MERRNMRLRLFSTTACSGVGVNYNISSNGRGTHTVTICGNHQETCTLIVTLLRALRPDVGGWVTLSPEYWTGVPSDGGRAPYSAVPDKDLSWPSKLACCLSRQCKRICAKAETSQ